MARAIPVTVLDVANNRVTQIKTPETDGYAAVQVTYGKRRASRVTKPQAGHLAKAGVEAGVVLKEFHGRRRTTLAKFKAGDVVGVDTFAVGQLVDVTGTTKGRGFSGVDQAPPLQLQPRVARQLALAQHAGLDRHGAGPGPRVSGQAHGGPATATSRARRSS